MHHCRDGHRLRWSRADAVYDALLGSGVPTAVDAKIVQPSFLANFHLEGIKSVRVRS